MGSLKRRVAVLASAAAAIAAVAVGGAPAADAAVSLQPLGNFQVPIYLTSPPGDTRRQFVVERAGEIRVVRDGVTLAAPFLNISSMVDTGGEGSLYSLAFPPDYATSGRFYVAFTGRDASPGQAPYGPYELWEFQRSATDPEVADPASGRRVLAIPHTGAEEHYGGQLQFGPDGFLYASAGDGGMPGDPTGNAQNKNALLGKILRIDPREDGDATDGSTQYRVPADNPFAAGGGAGPVWSYGFRNPYKFSFDRRTGDLIEGDVGEVTREEVNFAAATHHRNAARGANFGWNACEGTFAFPITPAMSHCTLHGRTDPVIQYAHEDGNPCGGSVTGGYVVRDPTVEELAGRYIYGDYCRGFVRSAVLGTGGATGDRAENLAVGPFNLLSFGEDACGRVYMLRANGEVSRIVDSSPAGNPCPAGAAARRRG